MACPNPLATIHHSPLSLIHLAIFLAIHIALYRCHCHRASRVLNKCPVVDDGQTSCAQEKLVILDCSPTYFSISKLSKGKTAADSSVSEFLIKIVATSTHGAFKWQFNYLQRGRSDRQGRHQFCFLDSTDDHNIASKKQSRTVHLHLSAKQINDSRRRRFLK